MKRSIPQELWGISQQMLFKWCRAWEMFPGSSAWEADHPIWQCSLPGKLSPYDAWYDDDLLKKAIHNLYYIIDFCIRENKDEKFVKRHKTAFESCHVSKDYYGNDVIVCADERLLTLILNRFTIAKIAPKVTALKESYFTDIIEESGISIENGVYCPMAGFGGIVRGSIQWLKNHGIDPTDKVYAADINPDFCAYYGWIEKDVLSDVVETDKVVVVCPPFSRDHEHWKNTPDKYADIGFFYWCKLLQKHVKAPGYIFIGPVIENRPQDKKQQDNIIGLFKNKTGVRYWSVDEVNEYLATHDDKFTQAY